jgi:bis(5'-nucleosyl)-tetraphosphatase (symmetrical)
MAIFAIGDVQGCYKSLRKLIKQTGFKPATDKLWFCGDLVNRGPQSADVLRYIMDLGDSAKCVLGNHDLNLLAVANGSRASKIADTLDDILDAPDSLELLGWLRHQPLFHRSKEYRVCIVHAGIYPTWSISKTEKLAHEVQKVLRKGDYKTFLDKMFGNYPAYWDKNLQGWDRLRFITNVMTRMRYLDSSGALELDIKCPPGKQPAGFHPWYSVECKRKTSWKVFYGHWSTLGLHWQNNAICLDSGCLWGGELTAARIDIPELQFISQSCRNTRNLLKNKDN